MTELVKYMEAIKVQKIITAKYTEDRLSKKNDIDLENSSKFKQIARVETEQECQVMLGFGGAFTEAAAVTLFKMSDDLRQEVIEKYYDKESGLAYNLGRIHIHSCDFSLNNYTYVNEGDKSLDSFDISRDKMFIIPLIREAIDQRGDILSILASPWSPPAWMKTNNNMNKGGKLLPEYFESWALYYAKFIKAYEDEGIDIWGLTVQNEPEAAQRWDSCIYTAEEERDFIKNHLGPTLHKAGYEDKRLLIWDHNRDVIVHRAKVVLEDPEAAKYVWGTGFHWYVSEEFENIGKVHDMFQNKHLLFTEGCQEGGPKIGEWFVGERYGRNMIGDFNNWCEGYIDWNIVLDEAGGPNHVNNLCSAPIIADTVNDSLHYNSSYYYIGHFSKYIDAGAKRLISSCSIDGVYMVAFKNMDDRIVIVIMNENEKSQEISIKINDKFLNVILLEHSIATFY